MTEARTDRAILVHHIGAIGDTVVSLPALRAVRRHWPGHRLVLLSNVTPSTTGPRAVLEGDALVDEFLEYNRRAPRVALLRELARLTVSLVRRRFDAAVSIMPSERAATAIARDRRFFRACGIRQQFGFTPIAEADTQPAGPPAAEWARKLWRLSIDGIPIDTDACVEVPLLSLNAAERERGRGLVTGLRAHTPRLAMGIAGACASKGWPLDRFETVGRRARAAGADVLIVGGQREARDADALVAAWGGGVNTCGESVRTMAALLDTCDTFVGVDSGPAHVAAAMGVSTVVVSWAGHTPGLWNPVGDLHTVLRRPVPCVGCRTAECPIAGHPCMTQLNVDDVWQEVARGLNVAV
jgi:ADP-heptose:LPS heptosyltransferase